MAAMDADSRFGAILKLPEDDTKIIVPALETLINDEPNHARAHTLLAMVLVAEDKSNAQRATSLARKAVTLRPSRTLPLLGLARVLVVCSEKPDENKELVETLEKIVELEQKGGASLVEALFYLVVKCTPPRAKLDDKSRLWYAQLAEQEKVTPKQHFELGSFFRKRDVELCKKHLQAVHAAHAADGGHADIAAKSTFWLNTIGDESQGRVERCPGEYVCPTPPSLRSEEALNLLLAGTCSVYIPPSPPSLISSSWTRSSTRRPCCSGEWSSRSGRASRARWIWAAARG
jgi:hypothetical protein